MPLPTHNDRRNSTTPIGVVQAFNTSVTIL